MIIFVNDDKCICYLLNANISVEKQNIQRPQQPHKITS